MEYVKTDTTREFYFLMYHLFETSRSGGWTVKYTIKDASGEYSMINHGKGKLFLGWSIDHEINISNMLEVEAKPEFLFWCGRFDPRERMLINKVKNLGEKIR